MYLKCSSATEPCIHPTLFLKKIIDTRTLQNLNKIELMIVDLSQIRVDLARNDPFIERAGLTHTIFLFVFYR